MIRAILNAATLCAALLFAGCGPSTTDTDKGGKGNDTDIEPTDTDSDTNQYFNQDLGSLMLIRKNNGDDMGVFLYGLFVDEHPGFQNLAECAVARGLCFDILPDDEDTYIEPNTNQTFDPLFSDYRYVGLTVSLGDFEANYYNDVVSYYYANVTEQTGGNPIFGDLGASFGVEWTDYKGDSDITVSRDIELQFPRPGSTVKFHDGDTVLIEWVPNNEGDVYLTVTAGINYYRMYLLEDDGYFELNADDLAFGIDSYDVQFNLARWNRGQVKHNGHTLDLVATSEVSFKGEYFYVGGRTEIELANTCGEALTAPITQPGGYWGRLNDWGLTNNVDPAANPSCTGFFARGEDGLFHVQLEPLQILTAEYVLPTDDASVYVLEDCTNVQTCVSGADENTNGTGEFLSYFNDTDEVKDVFLVADGYLTSNGIFYMDISIDQVLEPEMYNMCPDAMQQATPLVSGTYYTSYLPYTNTLDPGAGGCTSSAQVGPDSMTQVEVPNGQTLSLNINMVGGDPSMYLLYNCTNALSCAVGTDASVGDREQLFYTNNSGVSEILYLVIDSKTFLQPYFLTVDIQ